MPELLGYLKQVIADRDAARDDSILSLLLECRDDGSLDDDELLHFCGLMVVAGKETTKLLIANGARILTERPALWSRLVENSADLDLDREPGEHLAFGNGLHSCLGSSLARLEGRLAFEQMARHLEPLAVDPERLPVPLTSDGAGNFGWDELPLIATRREP